MRVQLSSATSHEIEQGLAAGDLDAGLTYLDNGPLQDVASLPLWRVRYLLVFPAGLLPVESGARRSSHSAQPSTRTAKVMGRPESADTVSRSVRPRSSGCV